MDLGPFMKSWVLPTSSSLELQSNHNRNCLPTSMMRNVSRERKHNTDDNLPKYNAMFYRRRNANIHQLTNPEADQYDNCSIKRTLTNTIVTPNTMRTISHRMPPILKTTTLPITRSNELTDEILKNENTQINRSTRVRRRKRVSDYYYSEDDDEANKNKINNTDLKNYEEKEYLSRQCNSKPANKRNRSMSPMNKIQNIELRRRSASPNYKSDNNLVINEFVKCEESLIPQSRIDTQDNGTKSFSNEFRKSIIIPEKQDIENNEHEYCNKCIIALQQKLIDTEELLTIERKRVAQLKNENKEIKEAKKKKVPTATLC